MTNNKEHYLLGENKEKVETVYSKSIQKRQNFGTLKKIPMRENLQF